jgi:hypothetical protein
LTNQYKAEPGYEIAPTPAARALVAYLFSLQSETPLFEAPIPSETAVGVDTNAPAAASTNVVAPVPPSSPTK